MSSLKTQLLTHFCTLLFGLSAIFGAHITADAASIVSGRGLTGMLTLALLLMLLRNKRYSLTVRDRTKLFINGMLLGCHWICFFLGVREGGVAMGTIGFASFPAFVIFFEGVLRRKIPASGDLFISVMILGGIAFLAPSATGLQHSMSGMFWSVSAGASQAVVVMFNRYHHTAASPLQSSCWQCFGCAMIALPAGVHGLVQSSPSDWLFIILLGVICTALAYWLLTISLRTLTPRTVSLVLILEPVYALVLAKLFLHQNPESTMLLAAALVTGASVLSVVCPPKPTLQNSL
ncbi:DMT family transporter [Tatumella citrea]|uniref:EamA domain-containing protein n=1 Tax=Tatumella citrea TaxID=53336 RepID=A0A1Y0LPG3_TATCI|nr:DMT family transporter [Tatumella citrea]ARU95862.1 hypothetical protein A7K98_20400 [Tatumella citrea]ARU99902.1 hypothetical protein A7K99_20385 [Tatumella citrea]